jgi:hypothetical protein
MQSDTREDALLSIHDSLMLIWLLCNFSFLASYYFKAVVRFKFEVAFLD